MKSFFITLITIAVLFSACNKEEALKPYASINVVNAAVGAGSVKVNYFGRDINWLSFIGSTGIINYGTNQVLTVFNLNNDYPFTIVPVLDTLKPVFKQKLQMEPTGMYTLFTTGAQDSYDAVLVKENNIAFRFSDSAVAIRFINLSPNSPAVNITLASTPAINETAALKYKQFTEFKKFADLKIVPAGSLTFQIRDAVSNEILTSYTLPATAILPYTSVTTSLSRFKSITLAIKGLAGTVSGTNAYNVFPIAHY